VIPGAHPDTVERELERLASSGERKFLLFANRREAVESYAVALEKFALSRGRAWAAMSVGKWEV